MSSATAHPNRLALETSPYLLQHAYNPVDWYPWGEEALQKARSENKPILVSIGYAACHWCHVMERESFENPDTARIMNEHFVNIKIDREERPDLDHIYMDAVQAMTGSGGWPLNVFLTPEGKPFYGGTYFPPQRAFNRASWPEVLHGVISAFRDKRHEIDAQADNLTEHLSQANAFGIQAVPENEVLHPDAPAAMAAAIQKQADTQWGGFGKAPKFPQTFTIQYLLRYHHYTGNKAALEQALLSLDRMLYGGLYDQIGGGFARYSTDTEWLVPHFEKMLYDNALLVTVYSEAFRLTGLDRYRRAVRETLDFVQQELLHPDGGFYAALDADSEGVEGKYYVWNLSEVQELLGEEAGLFCAYYDITKAGNWEHQSICWVKKDPATFAAENGISLPELEALLARGRARLLGVREKRVRPLLDDKVILGWNALMNTACSDAFAATGDPAYRELALRNMHFLLSRFREGEGPELRHTWKNGSARFPAFLDDYAFLIQALIRLQEVTGDASWLEQARELTEWVEKQFSDTETPFFFYTPSGQADIIVRKKEVYDGAVPAGNSVMARNAWHLGMLLDRPDWKERARAMVLALGKAVQRYPTSFGVWASLLQEMLEGTAELALLGAGEEAEKIHRELLAAYVPDRVLMKAGKGAENYPLLAGKSGSGKPSIFLCRNYTCQSPVFSVEALMSLIDKGQNR